MSMSRRRSCAFVVSAHLASVSISDTISIFVCLPFIQSLSFSVNVQYNVVDHEVMRQLNAKELEHCLYGRAIHLHHTRV